MALDDVKHVEAVALIRRMLETSSSLAPETRRAAEGWLKENHPEPHAFIAAMRSLSGPPGGVIGNLELAADEGMGV